MLAQIANDFPERVNVLSLQADARRLVAARYFILLMGVGMLGWLAMQMFFGGGVTFIGGLRVVLVSILGSGLVWAVSDKELRLIGQLQRKTSEATQRSREVGALNRMAQAHLADCSVDGPTYLPQPEASRFIDRFGGLFTDGFGRPKALPTAAPADVVKSADPR